MKKKSPSYTTARSFELSSYVIVSMVITNGHIAAAQQPRSELKEKTKKNDRKSITKKSFKTTTRILDYISQALPRGEKITNEEASLHRYRRKDG